MHRDCLRSILSLPHAVPSLACTVVLVELSSFRCACFSQSWCVKHFQHCSYDRAALSPNKVHFLVCLRSTAQLALQSLKSWLGWGASLVNFIQSLHFANGVILSINGVS